MKITSFPSQLESISEESAISDKTHVSNNFLPVLRSGVWSDIGGRPDMEDTHVCIPDLARSFGYAAHAEEAMSFYGVNSLNSPLLLLFRHVKYFVILIQN